MRIRHIFTALWLHFRTLGFGIKPFIMNCLDGIKTEIRVSSVKIFNFCTFARSQLFLLIAGFSFAIRTGSEVKCRCCSIPR
jgi:hypothetical protein